MSDHPCEGDYAEDCTQVAVVRTYLTVYPNDPDMRESSIRPSAKPVTTI